MTNTAHALHTLCVVYFGEDDDTTLQVLSLLDEGYELLAVEAFSRAYLEKIDPDNCDDFNDDVDECGFDPYQGCYDFDC